MKRDFELIREILLQAEAANPGIPLSKLRVSENDSITSTIVVAHIDLLIKAGMIEGDAQLHGEFFVITGITWEGYDFLDATRSQSVWKKIMAKAKELGGSMTLDIAKDLGKHYLKQEIGLDD